MLTAKDIMVKDVIKVAKGTRLSYAIKLMRKHKISRLVVVDDSDKVLGVITETTIMDRLGAQRTGNLNPSRLTVVSVMSDKLVTAPPSLSVFDIAKIMVEKDISGVPIVVNNTLVGLITKIELLKLVANSDNDLKADEFLDSSYKVIPPDVRIIHARQVMLEGKMDALIVGRNNEPMGIITDRIIANALAQLRSDENWKHFDEVLSRVLVEDIMITPQPIKSTTTVSRAARSLLEERVKALAVVDDANKIIGSISRTSIIRGVAEKKIIL